MAHWTDFLDPTAPAGGYLAWREVSRRTSLSRTTAWRLQKRGEFPRAYPISPGRVGHLEREVEAWIASRASTSSERPGRAPPTPAVKPPPVSGDRGLARAAAAERPTVAARAVAPPVASPRAGRRRRRADPGAGQQITFNF